MSDARPPQDVRPGGQHVTGQGVGQKVTVGQHHHPRAQRRQQVAGQGLLPDRVRAKARPDQRPGPRLRRGQPADLRKRPVPGRIRGAGEERGVLLGVRHVAGGTIDRDHPQPAAEHPRHRIGGRTVGRAADRAGDRVEQHVQRIGAQPGPGPRQVGDVRRAPPPALPGIHPTVRIQHPGQQLPAAAAVIQPVDQLAQHPGVAAVAAPEQPQRQHEVHHEPGRQQPATDLPGVGHLHHLIHQLGRERLGQRPYRHPVGQPPLR